MVAVDLDLSVALFDRNKVLVDLVYFGQLQAKKVGLNTLAMIPKVMSVVMMV